MRSLTDWNMDKPDEAIQFKQTVLEKIKYGLQIADDPIMLQDMTAEQHRDIMTQHRRQTI